ncbi:MAG: ribulose-phosphate 3-epimerase [Candidatus Yanofskybacteria bacterium]|nr:ribulose-phosphate 3-epimerase [Candidatus Yanofskybacteria bacterium]
MVEIIPAILTNSSEELEKEVHLIEPYATRAHLDIADGIFVPNETFKGYSELGLISTDLKFDVHLMVKDPVDQISYWYDIEKADRFIVHIESEDVVNAIKDLKQRNKGVGLALNPDTPTRNIESFVNMVDFVQFMTVNPGFQGGGFVEETVLKIENFHAKYPFVPIAVDGGIHPENKNVSKLIKAGASLLVVGSHIVSEGRDVGKAIEELKKISENK